MMKTNYMDNQHLLETEREDTSLTTLRDLGLYITRLQQSGNLDEHRSLRDLPALSSLMPYIGCDFGVLKLYTASNVSNLADSANQKGIPVYVANAIKKETFVKISAADTPAQLQTIINSFLDMLEQADSRYNVSAYSYPVQRAIADIHQHTFQPLSPSDVAGRLHMERTYLSRRFHQEVRMTITDYIHTVKTDAADTLIPQHSYSLTEIADILGYSSYDYFRKIYKKYKHRLPGTLRK